MADPLARHEDRQLHVVLDLAHLERRRMAMPHQVVDQPAVLADLLGAAAVAHPGGLHDGSIVSHVVDDADKSVIENRQRLEKNFLQGRRDRPQGRLRAAACLVDLGLLVGGEGHGRVLTFFGRTLATGAPLPTFHWPFRGESFPHCRRCHGRPQFCLFFVRRERRRRNQCRCTTAPRSPHLSTQAIAAALARLAVRCFVSSRNRFWPFLQHIRLNYMPSKCPSKRLYWWRRETDYG